MTRQSNVKTTAFRPTGKPGPLVASQIRASIMLGGPHAPTYESLSDAARAVLEA